jgi:protein-disulfide isomerase
LEKIMRRLLTAAVAVLILTIACADGTVAQTPAAPSTPLPADAPDAFGARVRAYLLSHPEVIMEAVQILQQRQQAAEADAVKGRIAAHADEIFRDPSAPIAGNPRGDITLVEFFDYNCPYCRQVAPTLTDLRRADPGLRLVYKEFPILGPGSEAAARAALAAERQGKYQALHDALMQASERVAEEDVLRAAAAVGLDVEQLKRDMADPAIEEAILRNRALAAELGINGTPGFVIADRVLPGAVEKAALEGLIAEARGQAKGAAP